MCVCNIILKTRARGEVWVLWSCTKETWDRTVEKRPRNKQEWAGEEWGKERQGGGESSRKKKTLFENVITIPDTGYDILKIKS